MEHTYAPDRASRQLTTHPQMRRQLPPMPERGSIFGDTYNGVPNPMVPFTHGYPTRYHGAIWSYPQPGHQYAPRPYVRTPFLGFGQSDEGPNRLLRAVGWALLAGGIAYGVTRDKKGTKRAKEAAVAAAVVSGGLSLALDY